MAIIGTRVSRFAAACVVAVMVTAGLGVAGATPDPPTLWGSLNSFKLMDVPGGSGAPGTQIVQWAGNGGPNQLWQTWPFATVSGVDLVVFQNQASGLVLDVAGGSTADGSPVVQNPWTGSISQIWWAPPVGNGVVVFINMGSGKVVDVAGASLDDGAGLIQWPWNGGANQLWADVGFAPQG